MDVLDAALDTGVVDVGAIAPVTPGTVEGAAAGSASATLKTLAVKGRAPKTGYTRQQFGRTWADIDRDGCDQRNQVLARDMDRETFKAGTHDCVVLTGTLRDSYTGTTIAFTRGQGTSEKVQIDHVVALSDAWQKGAQQLDAATREKIGNDPLNLIAVDGPTNGRKSDGDAATWLPPDSRYRCAYVARQVAVKKKYKLWVTSAERDAIDRVLRTCPTRAPDQRGRRGEAGDHPALSPARPRPPGPAVPPARRGRRRLGTCRCRGRQVSGPAEGAVPGVRLRVGQRRDLVDHDAQPRTVVGGGGPVLRAGRVESVRPRSYSAATRSCSRSRWRDCIASRLGSLIT